MKHRVLLVVALVLLGVGAVGLLVLGAVAPLGSISVRLPGAPRASTAASAGQRIFQTGLDSSGRVIPRSAPPVSEGALMMGGGGCASCHGSNGQGSVVSMMMGYIEAPDITYANLKNEGYTDSTIYRAIRDGVDEDGKQLGPLMPRWQMTDAELRDVVAYLKELSGQ